MRPVRPHASEAVKPENLNKRLANTPDHLLPSITPEFLAGMTGAPLQRCEYELIVAKQKRVGRR